MLWLLGAALVCRVQAHGSSDDAMLVQASVQGHRPHRPGEQDHPEPDHPVHESGVIIKSATKPLPKDGDIFTGEMKCSHVNVGLRITIKEWPKRARVYMFPQPMMDFSTNRWCPPITNCSAGFDVTGTYEDDILNFTPVPEANGMASNCGWPAFNLVGTPGGRPNQLVIKGSFEPEPQIKAMLTDVFMERYSIHCKQMRRNVLVGSGGHVDCHKFELDLCNGQRPDRADKVIYALRAFSASMMPAETDSSLSTLGRKQAISIAEHPLFIKAFGDEEDRRAEVIYVGPTSRALESAILAFGTRNITMRLDVNLIDKRHRLNKEHAKQIISSAADDGWIPITAAGNLMGQYNEIVNRFKYEDMDTALGDSDSRMENFKATLLSRPERRIIVVGHKNLLHALDLDIQPPGSVDSRILFEDGGFSKSTYDPTCWGQL